MHLVSILAYGLASMVRRPRKVRLGTGYLDSANTEPSVLLVTVTTFPPKQHSPVHHGNVILQHNSMELLRKPTALRNAAVLRPKIQVYDPPNGVTRSDFSILEGDVTAAQLMKLGGPAAGLVGINYLVLERDDQQGRGQ